MFKGWSGNPWDPLDPFRGPLHKSYFHNTDILFALGTFILSQIHIGPFQRKLNMILQQTEYKKYISLPLGQMLNRFAKIQNNVTLLTVFIFWKVQLICMVLLLSYFSRVQLCVTPQTAAHQAPLSLGFSRQEHWSGLPFPSPVHESEK